MPRLLELLLDRACAAAPAAVHDGLIVFGSAPMVLAGLKADVSFDLDLLASDAAYEALRRAGFAEDRDEIGIPRLMIAPQVEVVREWPGVRFADVDAAARAMPGSHGLRVAALVHVLAWKERSVRQKDRDEAAVIRAALEVPERGS